MSKWSNLREQYSTLKLFEKKLLPLSERLLHNRFWKHVRTNWVPSVFQSLRCACAPDTRIHRWPDLAGRAGHARGAQPRGAARGALLARSAVPAGSFWGSFSAGSTPIFPSRYAFFSIFQKLQENHLLASKVCKFFWQIFSKFCKICKILQDFRNLSSFLKNQKN